MVAPVAVVAASLLPLVAAAVALGSVALVGLVLLLLPVLGASVVAVAVALLSVALVAPEVSGALLVSGAAVVLPEVVSLMPPVSPRDKLSRSDCGCRWIQLLTRELFS